MSWVLVVDDEAGMRDLLKWFLISRGHAVSTAADGFEGLRKVQDERPDAVLLDINLPRMNGLEVLRHIREFDPEVGVIMMSGLQDKETRETALGLGALAYLTKPVDLRAVEAQTAKAVVGKKRPETLSAARRQTGPPPP